MARQFSPTFRRATVIAAALLIAVLALLSASSAALAASLVVNPADPGCPTAPAVGTYCTIQAAIDAAGNGDTITVKNGTYAELAIVSKSLTLNAESLSAILANGIRLQAAGVKINGFTVQDGPILGEVAGAYVEGLNAVISNNAFAGPGTGGGARAILVGAGANGSQILGNTFDSWTTGVYLNPGSGHLVMNNTMTNIGAGVGLDSQSNTKVQFNNFVGPFAYEAIGANDVGTNVVVKQNQFPSGGVAIHHYGPTGTLITESNWFGRVIGPIVGQVIAAGAGVVDTTSYLPANSNVAFDSMVARTQATLRALASKPPQRRNSVITSNLTRQLAATSVRLQFSCQALRVNPDSGTATPQYAGRAQRDV